MMSKATGLLLERLGQVLALTIISERLTTSS